MNAPVSSTQPARPPGQARDLQAQLYRDIGISAVAAALRFTTMPDPVQPSVRPDAGSAPVVHGPLAA